MKSLGHISFYIFYPWKIYRGIIGTSKLVAYFSVSYIKTEKGRTEKEREKKQSTRQNLKNKGVVRVLRKKRLLLGLRKYGRGCVASRWFEITLWFFSL